MGEVAFERYRLPTLIGQRGMGKVIAAAAALAFVPFSVVATTPGAAQAAPCAGVVKPTQVPCQLCLDLTAEYHIQTTRQCYDDGPPIIASPSRVPVLTPQAPPEPAPPVQAPPVVPPSPPPPSTIPPALGAPRNASLVAPPKALDAPSQAVAAAKAVPATRVNPAAPPKPPTQLDFNHQGQNVVNAHSGNVDVVKVDNQALVVPATGTISTTKTTLTARACTTRSIRR